MILIRDYPNGDRSQILNEYLFVFDYLGKPYGFKGDINKLSDNFIDPWYYFIKPNKRMKFNTHRMMYAID